MNKNSIKITSGKLSNEDCMIFIQLDKAGGNCVFIGTVRNSTLDRPVQYLEFECYEVMAIKEFEKIIFKVRKKWNVEHIFIEHRIGRVEIGEAAVIIGVSSAHRAEAFDACRYIIDQLKQTVPIWKKEVLDDGEVWVSAHP